MTTMTADATAEETPRETAVVGAAEDQETVVSVFSHSYSGEALAAAPRAEVQNPVRPDQAVAGQTLALPEEWRDVGSPSHTSTSGSKMCLCRMCRLEDRSFRSASPS